MKILLVQDYLRSGGTERQSVFLANAFAAAGHPTTLLTFRPGGTLAPTVAGGVQRRVLQSTDLHLDWFAPGLGRAVRDAQPDIVLCMGRMANCWGATIRKHLPSPTASVVCTMRTGKKLPWLFRRSLHACRHIVANSREARDTLVRQHGISADKISVIYNSLVFPRPSSAVGEAPPPRTSNAEHLRTQFGAQPTTNVLLCVAMFRPEKNQRELVEICAGLRDTVDWQLWLAGDGPGRGPCEQLVADRNLGRRVKFLGLQRDPSAFYAAADIAVHASWSESLSNFLIEAQANGLPAIAYEAQGIRECFVPDRTGWAIRRDDRDAFRAALLRLFGNSPEVRRNRAIEATTFARTTFDPDRQVQAYLDLFVRLPSM